MVICDQPIVEKWSPDFSSSGVPDPAWTRVKYGQTVLCNSLEWTQWNTNPVQVELCDACGTVGCASGGYVDISALGNLVLWTMPSHVTATDFAEGRLCPATAIERFGSVAFPNGAWESLHVAAVEVPRFESLARADGLALRDAWAGGQHRPRTIEKLLPWLRACLIAADTMDVAEAIRWVEYWLRWFGDREGTPVGGVLADPENTGARMEKFYFDCPGTADWIALAQMHDSFLPALGPNHIFVPADYKGRGGKL